MIATHPYSPTVPAKLDFSAITTASAGKLLIAFRSSDRGLCRAIIMRAGRKVEAIDMHHGGWIERTVPFNRETVEIVHEPIGWTYAFMATTYRIER